MQGVTSTRGVTSAFQESVAAEMLGEEGMKLMSRGRKAVTCGHQSVVLLFWYAGNTDCVASQRSVVRCSLSSHQRSSHGMGLALTRGREKVQGSRPLPRRTKMSGGSKLRKTSRRLICNYEQDRKRFNLLCSVLHSSTVTCFPSPVLYGPPKKKYKNVCLTFK